MPLFSIGYPTSYVFCGSTSICKLICISSVEICGFLARNARSKRAVFSFRWMYSCVSLRIFVFVLPGETSVVLVMESTSMNSATSFQLYPLNSATVSRRMTASISAYCKSVLLWMSNPSVSSVTCMAPSASILPCTLLPCTFSMQYHLICTVVV